MIDMGTQAGNTIQTVPSGDLAGATAADLAEILFCSSLQPSQGTDPDTVRAALQQSLRLHEGRVAACAEELAACYGKEPDVACHRMRWCRDLVARLFPNVPAFG